MSQWQPIETAPKDGTWLLLWWPYWRPFVPVIGFCINGKRWHAEESLSSGPGPTHWMLLPEPPKGDEK